MKISTFLLLVMVAVLVSCEDATNPGNNSSSGHDYDSQPNIVFLLIDDLGISSMPNYGDHPQNDTGWTYYQGAKSDSLRYYTPVLDSFGQISRVYTNMYATSLCAPSRGELITGRYPFRNGVVNPAYDSSYPADFVVNNLIPDSSAITTSSGYLDPNQIGYPQVLQQQVEQ